MRKANDKHAVNFEAKTPLKGLCHEIVDFRFLHESSSPGSPIIQEVALFRFSSKTAEIFATSVSEFWMT